MFLIFLGIFLSNFSSISRIEQEKTFAAQEACLAQQINILNDLLAAYKAANSFSSNEIIDIDQIDTQHFLSSAWLKKEITIYRTVRGFFIHIRFPKKNFAQVFLNEVQNDLPITKDFLNFPTKMSFFCSFRIGYVTETGMKLVYPNSENRQFIIETPSELPLGSFVILILDQSI